MYGMYVSASGAQAFSRYLDVLSNNIANVDTAGFRRQIPVLQARHTEAIEQGTLSAGLGGVDDVGGGVYLSSTPTQFTPGAVEQTGRPQDLALADTHGNTFFLVEEDGNQLLTRAGNFWIDQQGELRTQGGGKVLGYNGTPVRLDPRFDIQVSEDGVIRQPQANVQVPLALQQPQSLDDLVQVGDNTFRSRRPTSPAPVPDRRVRQGYLEKSSIKPMQEMVELIKASRAYEANVRMIQNQDTTTQSLINRVLQGE